MATNLLIGYPDIPTVATVTSTSTADTLFPFTNLFGGNKTDRCSYTNIVIGGMQIKFVLSSAKSANFLYVGNTNLLIGEALTTLSLHRNSVDNFGSSTTVVSYSPLVGTTLYGPRSEDLITTFAATTANAYWWMNYAKATSFSAAHSKVFFGTSFDMGRDPEEGLTLKRLNPGVSQIDPFYRVSLEWRGISYANTVSFYNTFYRKRRYQPIVLFTTSYHEVLNNHRVLFGRIIEATIPPRVTDYNDISMIFEEIV